VSIDADTKLVCSWAVGQRDWITARHFIEDLQGRLANRVQLTTDGLRLYLFAIKGTFGSDIDYGILVKRYAGSVDESGPNVRFSPPKCIGAIKNPIMGNPDPALVNTSFAERQNLTMRMAMRRFTRLTNAFSKKFENHCHSLALYFFWYNWVRQHKTLGVTPAMAAGLVQTPVKFTDLLTAMDAEEQNRLVEKRQALINDSEQSSPPQSN
jgi:IS1 family transposase